MMESNSQALLDHMYLKVKPDRNYHSKEALDLMNSETVSMNMDYDMRKLNRLKNDIKDIRSYKQLDRV